VAGARFRGPSRVAAPDAALPRPTLATSETTDEKAVCDWRQALRQIVDGLRKGLSNDQTSPAAGWIGTALDLGMGGGRSSACTRIPAGRAVGSQLFGNSARMAYS